MFNQRKAGLVCSFLINLIITTTILSNHLIAQTASNGFVNRENITGNELSANGFSVYSGIDLNNNGYGEFIVLSNQNNGHLKVFEAIDDNSYNLQFQLDLNDNILDNSPHPHQLAFGNIDNDNNQEIVIVYTNNLQETFVRIFDINPLNFTITEHSSSPAPSPGNNPVGICIVEDSNNNDFNEFVVASKNTVGNLHAYEWNGSGWSIISQLNIDSPFDIATENVNDESDNEIVVTTVNGLKIFSLENGILFENGRIQTDYYIDGMIVNSAQVAIGDIDLNETNEILVSVWWKYPDGSDQFSILIYEYTRRNRYRRDAASINGVYNPQSHVYKMQVGDYDNDNFGEIFFSNDTNTVDYIEYAGSRERFQPQDFSTTTNIYSTNDIMIRELCYLTGHNHYLDNDRFHDIVILTNENPNGPEVFVIESETEDTSLPVTLTSFSATFMNDHIYIEWKTESEINNDHFTLERSEDNLNYTKIAEIAGQGNTNQQTHYYFKDYNIAPGNTYYYRLADFDFNGTATYHQEIQTSTSNNMANEFNLYQNFPNPFNPETTIRVAVPTQSGENIIVSIQVFNTNGQLVKTIFTGLLPGGQHQFSWDGTNNNGINSPSGIYFTRFMAGNMIKTNKMMLIR